MPTDNEQLKQGAEGANKGNVSNAGSGATKEPFINRLDTDVETKTYSTAGINSGSVNPNEPIPEPQFGAPPLNKKPQEEKKKPDPVNADMSNLSSRETKQAAAFMANIFFDGYEWLHQQANNMLKVSEKKLMKLQENGDINLNAMIDYDYGKKIRAGEFIKEYNEQVSKFFEVSPEFKEEARPILERVLAKRGVAMTDEQQLLYVVGKDLAGKTIMFIQQKSQTTNLINSIKAATAGAPSSNVREETKQAAPKNRDPEVIIPEEEVVAPKNDSDKEDAVKPDAVRTPRKYGDAKTA